MASRLQLQAAQRGLLGAPTLATAALLPLCLLPVLGLALLLLLRLRGRPALIQAVLLPVLTHSSSQQQKP